MRIGLLVGACGLALTGVAHAEDARTSSHPALQNEFTAKRDAVVGAKNSQLRQDLEDDIRQMLREGRVHPRTVTLTGVIDEVVGGKGAKFEGFEPSMYGSPNSSWSGVRAGTRAVFNEAFETYTPHTNLDPSTDRVPLSGQIAPNGNVWGPAGGPDYNGVVNNAIAQTGTLWNPFPSNGLLPDDQDSHGVDGGPDPAGTRGQFFVNPRGSISEQPTLGGGFFQATLRHQLFAPLSGDPVITTAEYYLDSIDTFVWWRPVSFTEGFIVTNVFMGGYDFQYFAPFVNGQNIADRFIMLGPKPGSFDQGEFFGAADPHRIQTQEWISVALRQANDSFSVWVKDSTTTAYGFQDTGGVTDTDGIDWDGFPGDVAQGAFAGEVLQTGWLQWFPGVDDDIDTPVIEGNGTAFNLFNQNATVFSDSSGSPSGPVLFAFGVDALQAIGGSDPGDQVADFQPDDYYMDNYNVAGPVFPLPDPIPDFELPFTDDIELWNVGPVALQNDQWFDFASAAEIVTDQPNSGAQAVRQVAVQADNVFRAQVTRNVPTPTAGDVATTPVMTARVNVRRSDTAMSRAIYFDDNTTAGAWHARIILGARDGSFIVDNNVYVRLPNPDFDPTLPQPEVQGQNALFNPGDNVPFLNVPLVDGGGAPITTPTNTYFEVRVDTLDAGAGAGTQRIFIGGVEGFLDQTGLGLTTPITGITTDGIALDQIEMWSGNELNGLLNQIWIDDYFVDGPKQLVPTPLTVPNPPYTDDPAFTLPYSDGFETYTANTNLDLQGATPWLAGLFTDQGAQLDIIPAVGTVDTSTLGYYYEITEELTGTIPGGATLGDIVFVVDNIAPQLPPTANPIPGASDGTATRAKFRDATEQLLAQANWALQDNDGDPVTPIEASAYDGTTTVVGRYLFNYRVRYNTTAADEILTTDPMFPGNGQLVSMISSFNSGDAGTGDLDLVFTSLLPEASPGPGQVAELSFDLWIGIDDPAAGPRGRLSWDVFGPGDQAGLIARIVFGGPNNFLDENTFDETTGDITLGTPDGRPDNYYQGEPVQLGGAPTYSDTTLLYHTVPNPTPGFSLPDFVLEQTTYTVPGNTWIRCTVEIEENGAYVISLDDNGDDVADFTLSGDALEGPNGTDAGNVNGTDGLFLSQGHDAGASGLAVPGDNAIVWNTLGASAAPEGGTAALTNDATIQGSYNEVLDPTYFYFEIFEIDPGDSNLPSVTEINPASGAIVGPRPIEQGDIIALWNDQSTAEFGGTAGTVFDSAIARTGRFWFSQDGGLTTDARGTWTPLGLPQDAGINDPAPLGGMTNLSPPYNNSVPFATVLQGSIAYYPALPVATPTAQWFVDNIFMDLSGCFADLNIDGQVDGADLGLLLGNWGNAGTGDLNGSGSVDGADLGLLLGAWGLCP